MDRIFIEKPVTFVTKTKTNKCYKKEGLVAELKEINNKEKETKYENIIERDNVRLRD